MHVSALYIHPIKSSASLAVDSVAIEPRGPQHDRRWMLVQADGRFVSGRQLGALVRLRAEPDEHGLRLYWQDAVYPVAAPAGEHGRLPVTVWKSTVDAALADPAASAWLSQCLGRPLLLVYMDAEAERWANPDRAGVGQPVSFADGYPWLLAGAASLAALNRDLASPVTMPAFRPNIVFGGGAAWAEDGWQLLRIGGLRFRNVKPCVRCVFTTVDPLTGERRRDGEPFATLKRRRASGEGPLFGVNLVALDAGSVRVGDPLEVLDDAAASSA